MALSRLALVAGLALMAIAPVFAQNTPSARLALPERVRVLQGQLIDLQVEVRNATNLPTFRVRANDADITASFGLPRAAQWDCDQTNDYLIRADWYAFETPGMVRLTVDVTIGNAVYSDSRMIEVRPFSLPATNRRSAILYIGDAMGTTYRDAARLVDRSVLRPDGQSTFREGYFDDLLEMDKMPVSGMVMTYGTDSIIPDSANTGASWSSGNKTFFNAMNVFADGTDCAWRPTGIINATTQPFIIDNPRVETLMSFMKRRFGYRTGIVTTAAVTDATPAVQGSYTAFRQTRNEIARQYFEHPTLNGRPIFDVILGGGADVFDRRGRADGRDLLAGFQAAGYRYVTSAAALRALSGTAPVLGLFKGSATPSVNADGIRSASDVNMDVAYDKLGFNRPGSEPQPNFGAFTNQPMLEDMTAKAIEILSGGQGVQTPFLLMVEASSIDKQSHPNHYGGTIWDTIELDRAIGVGRRFASARSQRDTLLVVTADHDQSMHIIGVSSTPDAQYYDRTTRSTVNFTTARSSQAQTFQVFGDSFTNTRAAYPFINTSNGAEINAGPFGMPGAFPGTTSATTPSNYTTYQGFPLYQRDARTGYPSNTAFESQNLRRLAVGFRTGDHTGSSVPVTAEGPGAFLFTGYMDQTDIFFKMATSLTGDTAEGDAFVQNVLLNPRYPRTFGK